MIRAREFGDFQTPRALADDIVSSLGPIGERWGRVLEPTCGTGTFISAVCASQSPPDEVQGIELHKDYIEIARASLPICDESRVVLTNGNIFAMNLASDLAWHSAGPMLVLGNPPWITNSAVGMDGGSNLPSKSNFKGLAGLAAMTGASNFDIAEYIILKIIRELASARPTVALLCKTIVARNIVEYAARSKLPLANIALRRIDAKRYFEASVDACLFTFDVTDVPAAYDARVYSHLDADSPERVIGVREGHLVADVAAFERAKAVHGPSPMIWRQGVKHDLSSVMELSRDLDGFLKNGLDERVDIEQEFVFPLLKATDIHNGITKDSHRAVIVTETPDGKSLQDVRDNVPKLWSYLSSHRSSLNARKSSIYRNRPPFSMFGVGPYSFAPYKVVISGLHKVPKFRAIGSIDGKPIMVDDTCYLLACRSAEQAALVAVLLADPLCVDLMKALTFVDGKRPVTKKLLQRIDLAAILSRCSREEIIEKAEVVRLTLDRETVNGSPWPAKLESLLASDLHEGKRRSAARQLSPAFL